MGTVSLYRLSETKTRMMRLHILLVLVLVVLATSLPTTPEPTPTTPTDTSKSKLQELFEKVLDTVENILSKIVSIFRKKNDEGKVDTSRIFKPIVMKFNELKESTKQKLQLFVGNHILPWMFLFLLVIADDLPLRKTVAANFGKDVNLDATISLVDEVLEGDIFAEFLEFGEDTLETMIESEFFNSLTIELIEDVAHEIPTEEIEDLLELISWDLLNDVLLDLKNFNFEKVQETLESFKPLMLHIYDKLLSNQDEIFESLSETLNEEAEESGLKERDLQETVNNFKTKVFSIFKKIKNNPTVRKIIFALRSIDFAEATENKILKGIWTKMKKLPIVGTVIELLIKDEPVAQKRFYISSVIEGFSSTLKTQLQRLSESFKNFPVIRYFFQGSNEEKLKIMEYELRSIDFTPIINKMKGLNSDLQEKLLMTASKFNNIPSLNRVFEFLMNEEEMMKDLLEKDGDMESNIHHFEEFFKYVENILDDIADNFLISLVVNNLISKATEKLPLETVEETLLLVPWTLLEDTLENLQQDNLTIQNIQELVHAFGPLIEHVIDLISTFENELIAFFGEIISRENELHLDDMIDAGRKAELLLHHAADAITNNNLRYFTTRLTEHITKAINLIPKGQCATGRATTPLKVVCYYPNWVYYRKGEGKYTVDDIDTSLCTHIIYSFVILDGEKHIIKAHDTWLDIDRSNSRGWNLGNFRKFTALKQSNPHVKYMLALGGWNDSKMPKYSELLASPSKIERFVEHAVGFLKEYGFDGLDLDYEYPSYDGHGRDAPDSDKPGFTLLCKKLSEAFKEHNYELTAAVSASKTVIDDAYEVPEISKYLDAIHMMSYDLHGSWEKIVNHHSPIYGADWDPLTTDFAANYWVSKGCPKHKLIVGIPTYGRSWTLGDWSSSTWEYDINSTAMAAGEAGPLTKAKGFLAYNEICKYVQNEGWTKVSDPTNNMGPYAYKGSQWVGYDDPAIATVKAEYILKNEFGGAMFWDLPSDDFGDLCGGGKYPIIGAVSNILKNQRTRTCQEESPRHL